MLRLFFTLPLLLLGCHSQPPASPAHLSIAAQWSGRHSSTGTSTTQVVCDAAAWTALWQQIGRDAPHPFDPSRETAVAIFLGQRRTAGYAVELLDVRRENQALALFYREKTPAPDAMVAQVLTSPWAVAVLPASDLQIVPRRSESRGQP